ncbi:MAG: hypothetical protein WC325_04150 [Candidatus Bathyarchaeia archaeon]|jgi:hypothetical protein
MVKIGVDSSGHVKNPPIWMAATRLSKKKGQLKYGVYLSIEEHEKLRGSCRNWYEKISAILIFKAVKPIFYDGDAIVIDTDFQGSQKYVEKYLTKLFNQTYLRKPLMANPNIFFIPARDEEVVKHAHIKSKCFRYKSIRINDKNPNLENELRMLE